MPPLDDTTTTDDPSTWAPWTHRPVCINSTVLVAAPGADDGERIPRVPEATRVGARRFCVYTNAHLGDGGLSVITTPEQAADSLHLFEDPNLPAALYSASNGGGGGGTQRYEVVDMPEKGGKGVLATRAIRRFEPIILESAPCWQIRNSPMRWRGRPGIGFCTRLWIGCPRTRRGRSGSWRGAVLLRGTRSRMCCGRMRSRES